MSSAAWRNYTIAVFGLLLFYTPAHAFNIKLSPYLMTGYGLADVQTRFHAIAGYQYTGVSRRTEAGPIEIRRVSGGTERIQTLRIDDEVSMNIAIDFGEIEDDFHSGLLRGGIEAGLPLSDMPFISSVFVGLEAIINFVDEETKVGAPRGDAYAHQFAGASATREQYQGISVQPKSLYGGNITFGVTGKGRLDGFGVYGFGGINTQEFEVVQLYERTRYTNTYEFDGEQFGFGLRKDIGSYLRLDFRFTYIPGEKKSSRYRANFLRDPEVSGTPGPSEFPLNANRIFQDLIELDACPQFDCSPIQRFEKRKNRIIELTIGLRF